jgi:hypothetical protein
MPTNLVERSFKPVYGLPCWGIDPDTQLGLSMHFGKPSLDIREPFPTNAKGEPAQRLAASRRVTVHGQWWLLMNSCYWRLSSHFDPPVTSSTSFRKMERPAKFLDGQKLVSVTLHPETGATRFTFDLGCVLDCRRIGKDSADALWSLYKPNGYVLSVCGNGTIVHGK